MKHIQRFLVLGCWCLAVGVTPAQAVFTETTIYALQQDLHAIGDSVLVDSVIVIGIDIRPSTYGVYVQEPAGGPYSGILAYRAGTFPAYDNSGDAVAVGDLIDVRGRYADFAGLAEIDVPTLSKVGTVTPPAPVLLPVDSLKTNNPRSEQWEGVLIKVQNVKVSSVNTTFRNWYFRQYDGPAGGQVDTLGAYEKMISGQVTPQTGDSLLSVTGVLDYAFNERRIAPRNDADIVFKSPAPPPVPTLAYASAENKIKVRFNVPLTASTATTLANYSLSTFQSITAATYDDPTKTVTLTVGTNMTPSTTPHVLSMSNIRNSQNVIMSGTQTASFIGGVATLAFVQTPKSGSDSSQVVNQQVSVRGIVTETTGVDFPSSIGGFYMQQRGSTQYGAIFVFGSPLTPVRGDSVFVSGQVIEFGVGPETEITSVDEVTVLGSRPPMAPVAVSLANASGSNPTEAEKYEGMLIKISGVRNLTQAGPGVPFDISQSLAGSDTLRVDDLAIEESAYIPWRGDLLDVTGIVRYSGSLPFRRLQPRNWSEPPTGDIHVVSKAAVSDAPPAVLATRLLQNQPNPFNPTTSIHFSLAEEGRASLCIYDVKGTLVRTLLDAVAPAGRHELVWDGLTSSGERAGTGLYFYRLVAGNTVETRKMVLLK